MWIQKRISCFSAISWPAPAAFWVRVHFLPCKFARSASRNTSIQERSHYFRARLFSLFCTIEQRTTELQHLFHTLYILWSFSSLFIYPPYQNHDITFLFWGWMCSILDGKQMQPVPRLCSSPTHDHVFKTQSDCSWQTRSLYFLSGKQHRRFIHYNPDYAQSSILSAQFKSTVI